MSYEAALRKMEGFRGRFEIKFYRQRFLRDLLAEVDLERFRKFRKIHPGIFPESIDSSQNRFPTVF